MLPSQYVSNLAAHKSATYIIESIDGGIKETIVYNGRKYDETEFNNTFSITPKEVRYVPNKLLKGANPDKTKDFMD